MSGNRFAAQLGPTALLSAIALAGLLATGCATSSRTSAAPSGETGSFSFWPPPPDEPRVQFLTSFRFSSDVEPPQNAFNELVFGTDREVLPLGKPYGVEIWNGRIYVCDITNPGVVILDLVERETRLMGTPGVERMAQPTDIAIAADGMKYVVDRRIRRIFVFNADDRHVGTFRVQGFTPVGAAVHGEELFVADFESQSVLVLDRRRGTVLRSIGEPGGAEGQFIRPLGVDVDDEGNVFVTDVIRGRMQKFSADGELLLAVGEIADAAGNFVRPKHIVVDADSVVYVVDAAFQNVQMFNDQGQILMYFGSAGPHPGAMSLPAGIAVCDVPEGLFDEYIHPAFEAERLLIVTNQFGLHKVAVYAMGRLRAGASVADIAPFMVDIESGLRTGASMIDQDVTIEDEVLLDDPAEAPDEPEDAVTPAANPDGT